MGDTSEQITFTEFEAYLKANPDMFIQHPELLEIIELNISPEGTISLAQKQHERLKDKNRQLSEQLSALLDNAHSNAELQHRVHALCLSLLDTESLDDLVKILMDELQQDFAADDVALRLFYAENKPFPVQDSNGNLAQLHADDTQLRSFDNLLSKQQPVCGRLTKAQKALLFNDKADSIQSVACLPLGHEPCVGILAIGSEDANRFHADMATDYLSFLGDVFMRILRHHIHDHG